MNCIVKAALRLSMVAAVVAGLACPSQAAPWVTAYYPACEYDSAPITSIDLTSVTHLVWFALTPTSSGGLSDPGGVLANARNVVRAGHRHAGTKVLLSIGGADTDDDFAAAFSGHTSTLVKTIATYVSRYGFDGVDIDDEGINDGSGNANDTANYAAFIKALRAALPSGTVIIIAAQTYYPTAQYNAVKSYVNQINIMSYDLSGPFEEMDSGGGYYTWYASALNANGNTIPGTSTTLPSAESIVAVFEKDGIPVSELAIGAAFYGYDWTGATNIEQAFTFTANDGNWTALSYASIMANKYDAAYFHYDSACGAAYLGLGDSDEFITYDDANVVKAKVRYVLRKSLGGLICFELGQQYVPSGTTTAAKNPLMAAIDSAL